MAWSFVLIACICGLATPAQASTRLCTDWFKQKKYPQAAACFLGAAKALANAKTTTQKLQRGLMLRNASLAMRRAAKAEKDSAKASYMRERALQLMQRYLKEKLFADKIQKRNAESLIESLRDKIGYAKVVVLSGSPSAQLEVSGFHYKKTAKGQFVQSLRPGRYSIVARFAGDKVKARTIEVKADTPQVLKLHDAPVAARPAPKRRVVARKTPPRRPAAPPQTPQPMPRIQPNRTPAWIALISGGVLVLAGVGMGALAATSHDQRVLLEQEYQKKQQAGQQVSALETERLRTAWESSNQWLTASLLTGGVGLVALTAGVIMAVTSRPRPPTPAAPPTTRADSHLPRELLKAE